MASENVKRYINAYEVSRFYGGPEEGGWWYDSGLKLKSVEVRDDYGATQAIDEMWTEFAETYGYDPLTHKRVRGLTRSNLLGGSDLEIREESHPAENYPQQRPHYE